MCVVVVKSPLLLTFAWRFGSASGEIRTDVCGLGKFGSRVDEVYLCRDISIPFRNTYMYFWNEFPSRVCSIERQSALACTKVRSNRPWLQWL